MLSETESCWRKQRICCTSIKSFTKKLEVGISFQWLPKLYARNIHELITRTGQPRSLLQMFQSTLWNLESTWRCPIISLRIPTNNHVHLVLNLMDWKCGSPTVNQHPPAHHEGWMVSGQETVLCWVRAHHGG